MVQVYFMFTEEFGWFQFDAGASRVKSESPAKILEASDSEEAFGALCFGTQELVPERGIVFRYHPLGTGTKGGGTGTQL